MNIILTIVKYILWILLAMFLSNLGQRNAYIVIGTLVVIETLNRIIEIRYFCED